MKTEPTQVARSSCFIFGLVIKSKIMTLSYKIRRQIGQLWLNKHVFMDKNVHVVSSLRECTLLIRNRIVPTLQYIETIPALNACVWCFFFFFLKKQYTSTYVGGKNPKSKHLLSEVEFYQPSSSSLHWKRGKKNKTAAHKFRSEQLYRYTKTFVVVEHLLLVAVLLLLDLLRDLRWCRPLAGRVHDWHSWARYWTSAVAWRTHGWALRSHPVGWGHPGSLHIKRGRAR